jgi:hypothetical protein
LVAIGVFVSALPTIREEQGVETCLRPPLVRTS